MVLVKTLNDAPAPPGALTEGTKTDTSFIINWTASPSADRVSYVVTKNGALLATVPSTTLTYTFTGLTQNTTVKAGVKTLDASGALSPEATRSVTTNNAAPPAPANFAVTAPAYNSVKATWSPIAIPDFKSFKIWRNGAYVGETTGTSYTYGSAVENTNYEIKVQAFDTYGASSATVQTTVKTPLDPDKTPPGDPVMTSLEPEDRYGHMVLKFKTPTAADLTQYLVQRSIDNGAWANDSAWVNCNPNVNVTYQFGDYSVIPANAPKKISARVAVKDDSGNVNYGPAITYWLIENVRTINPNGSSTWRGGDWRSDASCAAPDVVMGRSAGGENRGCWFYGDKLHDALAGKHFVSGYLEYWREPEYGANSAIAPHVWVHNLSSKGPGLDLNNSNSDAGTAVARQGAGNDGYCYLSQALVNMLAGAWKGLAVYRNTAYTDPDNPNSFYMKLGPANTNGGTIRRSGQVVLTTWG